MTSLALVRFFQLSAAALLLSAWSGVALRAVEADNGQGAEVVAANPIRKVVTLLQTMAKKVEKEGEAEKELYDKFMCYCKTGSADLTLAISDSNTKVPALQSDIEETQAEVLKLKQDLKKHSADRAAAKTAMAEATSLREKEHAAYVGESGELKGYVDSLAKAIPAIESGMAGTGLLQAQSATVAKIRQAVSRDEHVTDDDKQSLLAFLAGTTEGTSEQRYMPKGGEIVGILKDMKEGFDKDLALAESTEAEALKIYEELMAAKTKEVQTLSASIEKKTGRVGELEVSVVRMKAELTNNEAALIENQKFLNDLDADCETKTKEMEERVKTRGEELVAIHETIKILNDDDALDLFKKALPSASFVQIDSGKKKATHEVLALLKKVPKNAGADVRFLELALMGRKIDFTKVFKMIDNMIVLLKQEQVDDDAKQEYCNAQLGTAQDKGKTLTGNIKDLEVTIEEKTGAIATFKEELKALNAGVAELDKLVAEGTEQRKEENEEFTELMSTNTAAKELLAFAKNRLQKFYNPKLYKAPPKTAADAVETEFLQSNSVRHSKKEEPGPTPTTWSGGYQKQGAESTGVISMLDLLVRDLDKEMTEAEAQEEHAQKEYEEMMNDSAEKRAKDVKAISEKQSAIADSEELLTGAHGDLSAKKQEFMAVETYISQLHGECDWLLQNFDLRKSARAEELDNLKQAKAILAGADFSLLQSTNRSPFLARQRS